MDQELFDAAKEDKVGEVLRTLLLGADPSSMFGVPYHERTPLHAACRKGHLDAVRALLLGKADIESRDIHCEETPLLCAAYKGHYEIVQTLLQVGADLEAKDRDDNTALLKASWSGQVKVVQLLLEKGADVRVAANDGDTALHLACYPFADKDQSKSMEIARMLLAKGADVGARDSKGNTPLHFACFGVKEDRSELTALLVENGAEPTAETNNAGHTPLHRACFFAHSKIAKILVEHGAQIDTKSIAGSTPLIQAAWSDRNSDGDVKNVVKFLLDNGATVNDAIVDDGTTAYNGTTALHWACYKGYLESARLLLDHGAALEAKDGNNETPLHYACSDDVKLDVVKELVQRGADIFVKGRNGETPLDRAKWYSVADYLLEQYKEKLWKREGCLSLHVILGESSSLENNKVQLPVGTLKDDEFLTLLVSIHSQDTDAIHRQDGNRALPLHNACLANAPMKVLCFFVEQDVATLYMMDSSGALPIHNACRGGVSLEKFKYLIEKGGVGTLCARDNQCALPLHVACQSKSSVDVVKYMLKLYPRSVSEKTSVGALPFMLACECSASESVLQELLTAHPEALDKMKTYYSLSSM